MLAKRYSFKEVAKVKNRAESIQLTKQLSIIDQQKHEEMSMLKNEYEKMAKRNHKLRFATTKSAINRETPEVVMYETHTPGFCYRCNGEQKIPSVSLSTITIEYNCLFDLVFTDDVLDIEKLLVLHLISVHKSETLVPVPNSKLANIYKDTSPVARLLEKSNNLGFVVNKTMRDLLPFYTIEIKDGDTTSTIENKFLTNRNNKLAHRILFNENLRKLISAVVAVLHTSNFPKFRQLIQLAHDPNAIRTMLSKPHILEFVEWLSEQQIVNSCENFVLTPPFKLKTRDLNVRTPTESLENLIRNLRSNVLQLTKRERNRIEDEAEEDDRRKFENAKRVKRKFSEVMTSDQRYGILSSLTSNTSEDEEKEEEEVLLKCRRSSRGSDIPDFVSKNIIAAGKTKKIEYDLEDDNRLSNNSSRKSSISSSRSRKVSSSAIKNPPLTIPDEVIRENDLNVIEDPARLDETTTTSPKVSVSSNESEVATDSAKLGNSSNKIGTCDKSKYGTGYGKYNIKITTCKACMEKWKQPLPTPKTPRVKKSSVLPEVKNQLYKTDSKHRINMLINKELYALESYDRRFSSSGSSKKSSKNETQTDSYDNININPMYLAKIEQEIKTKETQKKLEKFLKEPI